MMPSLFKYFTIVGGALLGVLFVLNSVLEPGGPGPRLVNAQVPKIAVKHDPRASKVERLRAEEAAAEKAKLAAQAAPPEVPVVVTEPPLLRPSLAAASAPGEVAPAQVSVQAALAQDAEDEAARAKQLAQERVKAEKAAAKARKVRIARERAKARAIQEASAQQVQPQQQQQVYGYAQQRPTFGPFGQSGGWGGGGWGGGNGNRW